MKHFVGIFLMGILIQGCQWFSKDATNENNRLARVGDTYLYKTDVAGLGKGLSPEDSVAWVKQYAEQWVSDQLLLKEAEEHIDLTEIDRMVEAYRKSLIINRYKNQWVEQKVPILIREDEIDSTYNSLQDNFLLDHPAVEMQFVLLDSANSSYTNTIKNKLNDGSNQAFNQVLELVSLHALDWALQNTLWMELNGQRAWLPPINTLRPQNTYNTYYNPEEQTYLIYKVNTVLEKGSPKPLPLCKEEIQEIVLQKRKQEFLMRLQKQAFEQATSNNDVEIFMD